MRTKEAALKTSGRFAQISPSKGFGSSESTKKKGNQIVDGPRKYMGGLILAERESNLKGALKNSVNMVAAMG